LCSLAMTIVHRTGIDQQKPLKTGAREKQAADFSVRIAAAERVLTQAEFAYYKTASSTSVIAEEGERNPTVTAPPTLTLECEATRAIAFRISEGARIPRAPRRWPRNRPLINILSPISP